MPFPPPPPFSPSHDLSTFHLSGSTSFVSLSLQLSLPSLISFRLPLCSPLPRLPLPPSPHLSASYPLSLSDTPTPPSLFRSPAKLSPETVRSLLSRVTHTTTTVTRSAECPAPPAGLGRIFTKLVLVPSARLNSATPRGNHGTRRKRKANGLSNRTRIKTAVTKSVGLRPTQGQGSVTSRSADQTGQVTD